MRRGFACCLLFFVALVFVSAAASPVRAADYSRVGVRPGDTADYVVTRDYESADGETIDSYNLRFVVLDVVGTAVVLNETVFDSNGSVSSLELLTFDVSNGSLSNSSFELGNSTPLLVVPGLGSGDPFYVGLNAEINQTFSRWFAGTNRVCDFFDIQSSDISLFEWGYYWDQATGIMVRQFKTFFTFPGILTYETDLVATSLWPWDSPFYPFAPFMPIVVMGSFILLAAAAMAIASMRGRSRSSPPAQRGERGQMVTAVQVKRCVECGATLAEGASYCMNCGAIIGGATQTREIKVVPKPTVKGKSNKRLTGQKCIVCDLLISEGDELVRCPHCMNVAHKAHMLEWLHVRGTCPVCGERVESSTMSDS